MKGSHARSFLLIVISITIFLVLIFSSAYAIISKNINEGSKDISATLGSRPILTVAPSKELALSDIPYIEATTSREFVISEDSASVDITLSAYTNTKCTYDVLWHWDETMNVSNQYHKTTGATKEYTISGIRNDNISFNEKQIQDYDGTSLDSVLFSSEIYSYSANTNTVQTWNFTTRFYKTKTIQTGHQGKSYVGKIVIGNVICTGNIPNNEMPAQN